MNRVTECPKCARELSERSLRCTCGWERPKEKNQKPEILWECEFRENLIPCRKKEVGRYGDEWLCREHGDEWILKNLPDSPQAKCILGARQQMQYAKQAGMTNREWAKENGFIEKFEGWRKREASNPKNDRPKTIFEFEAARLNENASKNEYSGARTRDLDLGDTQTWV